MVYSTLEASAAAGLGDRGGCGGGGGGGGGSDDDEDEEEDDDESDGELDPSSLRASELWLAGPGTPPFRSAIESAWGRGPAAAA